MKNSKRALLIAVLVLSSLFVPSLAPATSLSEVIAIVDQEYAAGQMDSDTHRDLALTLQNTGSSGSTEYRASVEAFRAVVQAYAGNTLSTESAGRILSLATGL